MVPSNLRFVGFDLMFFSFFARVFFSLWQWRAFKPCRIKFDRYNLSSVGFRDYKCTKADRKNREVKRGGGWRTLYLILFLFFSPGPGCQLTYHCWGIRVSPCIRERGQAQVQDYLSQIFPLYQFVKDSSSKGIRLAKFPVGTNKNIEKT